MRVTTNTISFDTVSGVGVGTIWCNNQDFVTILGERCSPAISATFKQSAVDSTWGVIATAIGAQLPFSFTPSPVNVVAMNLDKLARYTDKEVVGIWVHEVGHILNGDTLLTKEDMMDMDFETRLRTEIAADRHAVNEVGKRTVARLLWKTANDYFGGDQEIQDRDKRFLVAKAYRGRLRALFGD